MLGFNPHKFPIGYYIIHILCRIIVYIFYRKVHTKGLEFIPKTGPVIICSSHKNQTADCILLYAYCPRVIQFVIADSAWKVPELRYFLCLLPLIPIKRSIDYTKKGTGTITKLEGNIVKGKNTKFTVESRPKDSLDIKLLRLRLTILKVIDDETLEVVNDQQQSFFNFDHKYKIAPKLKQEEIFSKAWESLRDGNCIGIFPEGLSCDRNYILPLKAGAAVFCFGAKKLYGVDTKVIPCGMHGYKMHKFRSTIYLEMGKPYFGATKQSKTLKKFEQKESKAETISFFNKVLREGMETVFIHSPNYPEWKSIHYTNKFLLNEDVPKTSESRIELMHTIKNSFHSMREREQARSLVVDINSYHQELKEKKIQDWQLTQLSSSGFENFLKFIINLSFVFAFFVFSLPAFIFAYPQRIILHKMAMKVRRKLINAFGNRIRGNDVVASFKLLAGIPLAIVFMSVWNILYFRYCSHVLVDTVLLRLLTIPIFCVLFSYYASLVMRKHSEYNTSMKICQITFKNMLSSDGIPELVSQRSSLVERTTEFINKFKEAQMNQ